MGTATIIGLVWLALSFPASVLIGLFLREGDRELAVLNGRDAAYVLQEAAVSRTASVA
jgi:hypothetical protein